MEIQRESIFVSALRGFCKSLFVMLGIFTACLIVRLVFSVFSSPYQIEEKTQMVILPDLDWKKEYVSFSAPVILQVNIHGIVGDPENLNSEIIENILIDSHRDLLQHNRVKGILLHFDTPGGTVFDSDNIYRLLLKYKEKFKVPIFGYVDNMCASGGMYIASAADRLYCSHSGVVGSVGVRAGPFFNFFDAMTKYGVQAQTLTEGLDKDMMNSFRPWKHDEAQNLQELIAHCYSDFVDVVTKGRPGIDRTKLINEYGAKIWDGPTAQQLGYVDVASSTYDDALAGLLHEANIDSSKPYQVVLLQPQKSLLSQLLRGELGKGIIEHRINLGGVDQSGNTSYIIKDPFAYLYQP